MKKIKPLIIAAAIGLSFGSLSLSAQANDSMSKVSYQSNAKMSQLLAEAKAAKAEREGSIAAQNQYKEDGLKMIQAYKMQETALIEKKYSKLIKEEEKNGNESYDSVKKEIASLSLQLKYTKNKKDILNKIDLLTKRLKEINESRDAIIKGLNKKKSIELYELNKEVATKSNSLHKEFENAVNAIHKSYEIKIKKIEEEMNKLKKLF